VKLKPTVERFVDTIADWVKEQNTVREDGEEQELRSWYARLISDPPAVMTLENLARVLDVLRHPGILMVKPCNEVRKEVFNVLQKLRVPRAREFAAILVSVGEKPIQKGMPSFGEEKTLDELIEVARRQVITWGIRDWSRLPVGAGCHAWAVGAESWEIMGRLDSFSLMGRMADQPPRNVHICGEAVSDYQGFIEGALRSATRVTQAIVGIESRRERAGTVSLGVSVDPG
jgi:hypothetical protein